jgi:hypothetical protein
MRLLVGIAVLGVASHVTAEPAARPSSPSFDFVIVDHECQLLGSAVASIPKTGKSIVTGDGSKSVTICTRDKRVAHCVYDFDNSPQKVSIDYTVDLDTATLLQLTGANGDALYINPSDHVAVTTARQLGTKKLTILMMKLCRGVYMTHDEYEALKTDAKKDE